VEEIHEEARRLRQVKEEAVGRPSACREILKKMAEAKLETRKAKTLMMKAEGVHRMFVESPEGSRSC